MLTISTLQQPLLESFILKETTFHSIYEPTSLFKTTTTKCKDLNIISKSKIVHNHTCLNVVKSCCNCVSIMLLPIPNTKEEEDIHILYKLIRTLQSLHWCGLVAKSTSTQLLRVSCFPSFVHFFFFNLPDLLWDLVQSVSFGCMQSITTFSASIAQASYKIIYNYNLISFILFYFILGHCRLSLGQNKFVKIYLIVD